MQEQHFVKAANTILIVLIVGTGITIFILEVLQDRSPALYSPKTALSNLWEKYKEVFVEETTGRTVDHDRGGIATSEGQSYTMLRAVWMDDKETFDKAWQWTKSNLQREDDNLFSWLYGQQPDGSSGILLQEGGENTASDADTDIALSLLFAYARWQEPEYLTQAHAIIQDIWDKEVIMAAGKPYLAANNIEKEQDHDSFLVNPSYFAPYAYRLFAEVDLNHDWDNLVDTSYEVLQKSTVLQLGSEESAHLPPNWARIDKETGALSPAQSLTTDFGFEALRIPWRIALDQKWFGEQRATAFLEQFAVLRVEWMAKKELVSAYSHSGQPLVSFETPAMYGGTIGYFLATDKDLARDVYQAKLAILYNPDTDWWDSQLSYYDDNWAWFGMALYHNLTPNLWDRLSSTAVR